MASPEFKMEEQLSDVRSDQIAYKLIVSNPDSQPVRQILRNLSSPRWLSC
jgi:hypothetical protein